MRASPYTKNYATKNLRLKAARACIYRKKKETKERNLRYVIYINKSTHTHRHYKLYISGIYLQFGGLCLHPALAASLVKLHLLQLLLLSFLSCNIAQLYNTRTYRRPCLYTLSFSLNGQLPVSPAGGRAEASPPLWRIGNRAEDAPISQSVPPWVVRCCCCSPPIAEIPSCLYHSPRDRRACWEVCMCVVRV